MVSPVTVPALGKSPQEGTLSSLLTALTPGRARAGLAPGSTSASSQPPSSQSVQCQVKSEGPKLVPFFKATCVYFVLWLPSSSPSWVSALIKCLPIFCLWLFLLAHGLGFLLTHPSATRIFVGLVFSAIGDAFLIWQDQGYFVHGVLMFAVTHMLYASAFGMRPLGLRTGLLMVILSGLSYAFLYPNLTGAFTYLVGVYVAIIGFMGWRAMAGLQLVGAAWRWTELAAGTGALLFIVSDLTIALDKFCFPVPYSRAFIMSTYYAAQMLIALSAVESREPVEDYRLSKAK
ncbi:lysoplasmalogenase TMEM86A isoform X1 [Bubalus kerabau]|uniref:lysoplasmalogenase-like protein TMEM86A isoform X1 n=1 Tax=Bubalus bubalis TaxID=89462 RepID=UPI001D103E2B|nr:lysoplasmalogenase-like protein TMEM86A isoform X1 [Bubalus bubalis]XP_055437300.1 lysoplasmalogenase-like protein TMEM86A isoform X1 [Bubalus carabanensis]